QAILKENNYVFLFPSDETMEKIIAFKDKTNYDFNFLKLNGSVSQLGIYALPTTFIYNEKGEKVKEIVGSVIWDSKEMIKTLKDI
ncbi:MAG: TlpA family protein disulfide reductase, partial [Flavobacteriaceae bacterium]|nr:TlpA family protein disulfide reductase [Flavobacteriaceae bacterium]